MAKSYQWYYDGVAKGTAKTQLVGAGETNPDLWECRVQVDYGADSVVALAGHSAGTFSENLVTINGATQLEAPSVFTSATVTSFLLFGSYKLRVGGATRQLVASWGTSLTHSNAYVTYSSGSLCGLRFGIQEDGTNSRSVEILDYNETIGDRVHFIVGGYITADDKLYIDASIWSEGRGGWIGFSASQTTGGLINGDALKHFKTLPTRLFTSQNSGHQFDGEVARLAAWSNSNSLAIADPLSSSVRNAFASGASIVDPATSQALLSAATLEFDFYGDASVWDAGSHDGNLGSFTRTGDAIVNA